VIVKLEKNINNGRSFDAGMLQHKQINYCIHNDEHQHALKK